MRNKLFLAVLLTAAMASIGGGTRAKAQTDVAASVYGAFNGTTNGNGVVQSPSNSAGALIEIRHISNSLFGLEATYAFNRGDQTYTSTSTVTCGLPCGGTGTNASVKVPANAHEITADYLVSLKILHVRPFLLAGGGVLLNVPTSGTATTGATSTVTVSQTKGVLVYGGGLDYAVLPHLGLRFQYRGNVYKAPQLATAFSSTGAFTHTAEPMLGAYLRF
jgi:opacity protein-like surface antigen